MSKYRKRKLTIEQIENLWKGITVSQRCRVPVEFRYTVGVNKPVVQGRLEAFAEANPGPDMTAYQADMEAAANLPDSEKPAAIQAAKAKHADTLARLGAHIAEVDKRKRETVDEIELRLTPIVEIDDEGHPAGISRNEQNQALIEALLPMFEDRES